MNCPNCGAAMELVESGRHLRCTHCGTLHFPEPADADGIQILGESVDAPSCPVCKARMGAALLDSVHPVHFCTTCRGLLLPRATFAGVVNKRRAWATGPPAEPVPLDPRLLERHLLCPRCNRPFETHPYFGPGNVVIDNCPPCDLVWLDFGEIRQIVEAPGSDRGSREMARIDDEYVRHGESPEAPPVESADPLKLLLDFFFRGPGTL
jgi:Zn-finger nucleic acid-binding protein